MFEVEWTGGYPNLCSGEWIIKKDGVKVDLPEEVRSESMGTYGTYSSWHFEDWSEVFEDYKDGMKFKKWIESNAWAKTIAPTVEEQKELFEKISEKDWRHNSCGGCI